jgi:hypothetical protein
MMDQDMQKLGEELSFVGSKRLRSVSASWDKDAELTLERGGSSPPTEGSPFAVFCTL